jgi:predicted restriction endonuclease
MKLVNFASLDPVHQRRNVRGLRNASRSDREIFQEFLSNWEQLAFESEQALGRIAPTSPDSPYRQLEPNIPVGPTDEERIVRVRTVQRFFRDAVLASYENRCAICTISVKELLNASHIIPWSSNVARRADPTNGLALCSLHDRAFDRGLLTIDADFRVVIAPSLKIDEPPTVHRVALIAIEGKPIELPHRFYPDPEALRFHRENVFHNHL